MGRYAKRYFKYLPDEGEPSRFYETIKKFKKLYYGSATSKIHKLRVNSKRKIEIKKYRHMLGIREEGYGRVEGRRKLRDYARASLELEPYFKVSFERIDKMLQRENETYIKLTDDEQRAYLDRVCRKISRPGSSKLYKRNATKSAMWCVLIKCAGELADHYRLSKRYPTPVLLALEDLVYADPRPEPDLRGYYTVKGEADVAVTLEDTVTDAPQEIARMVIRRLRGDDNEVVKLVTIFNKHSNWGEWKISKFS